MQQNCAEQAWRSVEGKSSGVSIPRGVYGIVEVWHGGMCGWVRAGLGDLRGFFFPLTLNDSMCKNIEARPFGQLQVSRPRAPQMGEPKVIALGYRLAQGDLNGP